MTRFPCLSLTFLSSETFVLGLSSLLLLCLLIRVVPEAKHGITAAKLSGVRTNLALFFSGFSLGSSADLFNRALCLRGPASSTTSRFARLEGCTGLGFALALGRGGGGFFENPILFTASVSSNSSSSALFLAMFACLSSSLRLMNNSKTRYLRQCSDRYLMQEWLGAKCTHYAVGMVVCG